MWGFGGTSLQMPCLGKGHVWGQEFLVVPQMMSVFVLNHIAATMLALNFLLY